ncbi:MAG: prolyl oligopeptidase family serine peptidase, partial [Pseudobdellovibrionaceae bacterium]
HHKYSLIFRSANKCYLNQLEMTDDYLNLQILADLKSELWIYQADEGNCRLIHKIYKADCTLSSSSAFKNHVVIQKVGYLTPPHSELWDLDQIKNLTTGQIALDQHDSIDCKIRDLFAAETNFPSLDYQISRHSAVSVDGVQIPYIVISKKGSGTQPVPCLMYAYGGFARIPAVQFLGLIGTAWLQNGGCYVVAHIRGGNEYGPDWHQAAVQENRWKCFVDFAHVGNDLIQWGLTTSKLLSIRGGSK